MSKLNDNLDVNINIRWLIQIVMTVGIAVWGYFSLIHRISATEIDILRMEDDVRMNSEFRVKWPRGELGALPDDAEQNLRLSYIEKTIQKNSEDIESLKFK